MNITNRGFFWILFAISTLSLGSSLFVEFVLQDPPCFLCWIQRGIYLALLPLALLGIFNWFQFIIRKACVLVVSLGFLVASYHTLVQLHLVKDRCKTEKIEDAASFKAMLAKKQQGCSEAGWTLGPIPIPAVNAVASLGLVVLGCRRLARR